MVSIASVSNVLMRKFSLGLVVVSSLGYGGCGLWPYPPYATPCSIRSVGRISAQRASAVTELLTHRAFQAHLKQLARLDGEFHRQLFEYFPAEAVDDHGHRFLRVQTALLAEEHLVVTHF